MPQRGINVLDTHAEADHYAELNEANAAFWDEMCGSQLAQMLGITDHSPESLKRFDDWYFEFYPYLERHIPFGEMRGKAVLEVGLGYGTVAQKIAQSGALYQGLDVASGPVGLVNHRLQSNGLLGNARQGSVLAAPFANEAFDYVVAIGCYHHTGDVQRAVDESFRMLKPGGRLIFMVYYAYSYRRWLSAPMATLACLARERISLQWKPRQAPRERGAYDVNLAGDAAPITDFLSRHRLAQICRSFSRTRCTLENASPEGIFHRFERNTLINGPLARLAGLDIYVSAWK